jgi:hypothetical protein
MVSYIIPALRAKSVGDQARLLGSIRHYINNDNLINLMQNYDINNKNKDKLLSSQLSAFSGIPGIVQELNTWLNS